MKTLKRREAMKTLKTPKYMSKLIFIHDDLFSIQWEKPKPNWWWRMWQYLLLGIKWEDVE